MDTGALPAGAHLVTQAGGTGHATPGHLAAARSRLPEMVRHALTLVACESPSHDAAALEGSAALVARVGAEIVGTAPARVGAEGGSHLAWRFGSGPRRVLLLGHHDTVWPIGTLDRLPGVVADGVLRGPGCLDMKVGIVQALTACALVAERQGLEALDGVTVLVTSDEEVGSPGSRDLVEREAAGCEAVLVLEAAGPGGALKTARKGTSAYRVRVTGRAAHAGLEPEAGINAGVELARQIPAVAALARPALGTTVTPTSGQIGTTTNTVPAHAEVWVDVRAATAQEQHRVEDDLRALTARTVGARVDVEGEINRPPMEPEMSRRLLALAQQVATGLGIRPFVGLAVGGASDGNLTAGAGVPTLDGLGGVGGGPHADDEHVDLSYLPERTALLAGMIEVLLDRAPSSHEEVSRD
ncbi:M20 family metallopeptidase [Actinotalea sp. K2]|uniref:M20 family metallopeptidase n=1 Tax=Actinotalea sp. K2 TaxID=2939438 RepID=UPI00201735FE|nr:M20 family metallopeptidase [Actinotalea sp. K2]MCL3862463.1 M20 family metallopeptidase [Actinotalea sp. K2]